MSEQVATFCTERQLSFAQERHQMELLGSILDLLLCFVIC